MNRKVVTCAVALCAFSGTAVSSTSLLPDVKLRGYVGERFDACVKNQVKEADVDTFARIFRAKGIEE